MCTLLQLCRCSFVRSNTTTKLFEDATFLGLSVAMGAVLEHPVKVVLGFLPALFDCCFRDESEKKGKGRGTYARSVSPGGRRETRRRNWASIWSNESCTDGKSGRDRCNVRFLDAVSSDDRSAPGAMANRIIPGVPFVYCRDLYIATKHTVLD